MRGQRGQLYRVFSSVEDVKMALYDSNGMSYHIPHGTVPQL